MAVRPSNQEVKKAKWPLNMLAIPARVSPKGQGQIRQTSSQPAYEPHEIGDNMFIRSTLPPAPEDTTPLGNSVSMATAPPWDSRWNWLVLPRKNHKSPTQTCLCPLCLGERVEGLPSSMEYPLGRGLQAPWAPH